MSFALITDDAVLAYGDDGKLDGAPPSAVGAAQVEVESSPYIAGTPTGPWFERGTPEHAYLVLRALAPDAEVVGDPPEFEDVGPELPDEEGRPAALREAEQFDPHLHPRGRGGRFMRVFFKGKKEPVYLRVPKLQLNFTYGDVVTPKGEETDKAMNFDMDDVERIEELRPEGGKLVKKEAISGAAAYEHLNLLFLLGDKPWVGQLTDEEKNTLNVYRSPEGYQLINDSLRGKGSTPEERKDSLFADEQEALDKRIAEWIKLIDSAMKKAPATGVPLDMWMYRGVRDAVAVFGSDNPKPGTRISDLAYTSTTTNVDTARNFATTRPHWLAPDTPFPAPALVEVEVPAGAQGAWMPGAYGLDEFAAEFVLPRGSTFEVTGVRDDLGAKVGETLRVIEVKLVTEPRAVVEGMFTLDLLEADFDPAQHPRDRRGKFIRFLVSMPRNSVEHMASLRITRLPNGNYRVDPDVGEPTTHEHPESAYDAIERANAAADDHERTRNPSVLDADTFRDVFDGFEHGGLRARVDTFRAGFVQGTILDGDAGVGNFTREAFAEDGETSVYHNKLTLHAEYQGRGFGTAFFEHSLQRYQELDANRVTLTAADQVGGYQWARAGFDFDLGRATLLSYNLVHQYREAHPDVEARDVSNDGRWARAWSAYDLFDVRFNRTAFAATRAYGDVPQEQWDEFLARFPTRAQLDAYLGGDDHALDGTWTTPQEVATFGRDQHRWTETHDLRAMGKEMWLGKRFMLGAAWRGEIKLR